MLKWLEKANAIVSHLYTIFFVMISWVIFAFEDLSKVWEYLKTLFSMNNVPIINNEALYYIKNYIVIIAIGIIFTTPFLWKKIENIEKKKSKATTLVVTLAYVIILLLCTTSLVSDSYNPFLYFRF